MTSLYTPRGLAARIARAIEKQLQERIEDATIPWSDLADGVDLNLDGLLTFKAPGSSTHEIHLVGRLIIDHTHFELMCLVRDE